MSSNCIGLQTAFRPNGGWWLYACGAPHRQQGPFVGQLYNCVCRKWLGLAASPSPNFMARKAWESQTWPQRSGPARVQSCLGSATLLWLVLPLSHLGFAQLAWCFHVSCSSCTFALGVPLAERVRAQKKRGWNKSKEVETSPPS